MIINILSGTIITIPPTTFLTTDGKKLFGDYEPNSWWKSKEGYEIREENGEVYLIDTYDTEEIWKEGEVTIIYHRRKVDINGNIVGEEVYKEEYQYIHVIQKQIKTSLLSLI